MKKEDLRCEYSGLPSPQAYIKKQIKNEKINTKNTPVVELQKTKHEKITIRSSTTIEYN